MARGPVIPEVPTWMPPLRNLSAPAAETVAPVTFTQQVQRALSANISGPVDYRCSVQDLPATTSALKLYRPVANASSVVGVQLGIPLPARGSIAAITFTSAQTLTSGSATFAVFLDDTSSASVEWTTGQTGIQTFSPNEYPFAAGQILDIRATTRALSPTADMEVTVYVIFTAET